MSLPTEDVSMLRLEDNDPMEVTHAIPENDDDEGEGDVIEQGKAISDDSSDEEDEDEEEARKIREGFIVDEDEEEEEEEEVSRKKKRRKHKHRHRKHHDEEEEDDLDEEDLELLEENTGGRIRSRHLTRLRRGRDSGSDEEAGTAKRKTVVESSDDDLDETNIIGAREVKTLQDIWNDEHAGRDDDDDMDDFIDDEEDEEEGAGAMAREEREAIRQKKRLAEKERRKALKSRPELTGIDATAWDEIHDVFGDGHDYDWALYEEDEITFTEPKEPTRYIDIFEPSAIKRKFLTEDDDIIRAQDMPERMQLVTSTLSQIPTLSFPEPFAQDECVDAASWITPKLGGAKERDFFKPDGRYHFLLGQLVEAVTRSIEYLFIQFLEVPYIYAHRRDYISYFNPQDTRAPRVELLSQSDLWLIYTLGQKFRSLLARRKTIYGIYSRLAIQDEYYEEHLKPNMDSLEGVNDVTQWLGLKYKSNQKQIQYDDEGDEVKKHKLPSRLSEYEVAKKTIVQNLAEGYGIKSHEIVVNFLTSNHNLHFVEDKDALPLAYAEQFVDPDPSRAVPAEDLLRQARMIIATELGVDPLLRRHTRDLLKQHALISCLPTDKGKKSINPWHQHYPFLYLHNKPVTEFFERTTQFLQILKAEADHDVTMTINLANDVKQEFQNKLIEAFASDSFSEVAKAWNEERTLVIQEAVEKHLIPAGIKWLREFVREEVEENLAKVCGDTLYERINVAPYLPPGLAPGEQASILAVSWGQGDPKKDTIHAVFVDEAGRTREVLEFENLSANNYKDEFTDMVKRRKPDVIVVAGRSITTTKLSAKIKQALNYAKESLAEPAWGEDNRNDAFDVPVVYMYDDTARLFSQSKRAEDEFPVLDELSRYCVGLARYTQNPLNEMAALGRDITFILFDDNAQPLIPQEKLLMALERALVDVVNKVGVDINRAANDEYYAALLPYVAGLGPRKAQVLIRKVVALGGNIVNREQFIKSSILTTRIFMNAAGFLRIAQDPDYKEPKSRSGMQDYSMSPDPLDNTRIHPEDYELARKMATDALELDEEDVHDEHPSAVVAQIMKDEDNVKKLDELNLDEFAVNMYETNNDLKRHTLNVIRAELLNPFGELRPQFEMPDEWDVLTMLTTETERSLRVGFIIAVKVMRIGKNFVAVRLPSGIDGIINNQYLADDPPEDPLDIVRKEMTLQGVIIDIKWDLKNDNFQVELSTRHSDILVGDEQLRGYKPDEYWNYSQADRDRDVSERKKRAHEETARRVIKHPNFKNFNSGKAEEFLANQQPGEVIIRPSSKGFNHLAVTWKVAEDLYQHIDVVETHMDLTGQTLGPLSVDGKYEFADLDELIVNHVKAMSRRVEELMAHEKYKKTEDELHKFLTSFVAANPTKSIYGFTLNRRKPGHFHLSFLPKKGSSIQTWPVRVAPEAYYLFDAAAAGVSELCDAFKVRYLHESQNLAAGGGAGAGGKTPYGAGRMTPGYATPGRMSVRRVPRTPNPYPGAPSVHSSVAATTGSTYGGSTAYGGASAYGYQTPRTGAQPPAPGLNPPRAAVVQNAGSSNWNSGWR